MTHPRFNRRQFLRTSTVAVGAAWLSPWGLSRSDAADVGAVKRTAVDQVTLGRTGLKLSRLGFGTGTNSGQKLVGLGKENFVKLIRHGYDQGITYVDTSVGYRTFGWIGEAIAGLPREKLFLQSKMDGQPQDVLAAIDSQRKSFNTDYVDSLLIHFMRQADWTEAMKRVMDGFNEAKDRKWIRAKGVSCHTLPALRAGVASDWTEVHLVRVNPQGKNTDGMTTAGGGDSDTSDIAPVMQEIRTMRAKGHGVIGMKIFGAGAFTDPADREKSIRFAMACKDIDAVVIGFTSTQEIDEAIERMNRALAES